MSNNDFSNAFEERFNAPFGDEPGDSEQWVNKAAEFYEAHARERFEPDLRMQVGRHEMSFVILLNTLDYPPNEPTLVRGALTLGALTAIPREQGIYNTLRESLQALVNSAAFGGLLMTGGGAVFAGITITPLKHHTTRYATSFTATLEVQYLANRPATDIRYYQTGAGYWQREGESDEG